MKEEGCQSWPPYILIIHVDAEAACRQGRISRHGGDREVEEEAGGNNGRRMMGCQVGGRRLKKVVKDRTQVIMQQGKETKGSQCEMVFSATWLRMGYVFVKPILTFILIFYNIREEGGELDIVEGKRSERGMELFPATNSHKAEGGRMRNAREESSKTRSCADQGKGMHGLCTNNDQG